MWIVIELRYTSNLKSLQNVTKLKNLKWHVTLLGVLNTYKNSYIFLQISFYTQTTYNKTHVRSINGKCFSRILFCKQNPSWSFSGLKVYKATFLHDWVTWSTNLLGRVLFNYLLLIHDLHNERKANWTQRRMKEILYNYFLLWIQN